jgi:DNA-binding transcriptional MerR regulator
MTEEETPLELRELADSAGVTTRTIRYYIGQGLLPPPSGRGPGASYSREHLDRLLLIRRLQEEHLPLAEIRKQLDALDDAEVSILVRGVGAADAVGQADAAPRAGGTGSAARAASPDSSAVDYIRSVLEPRRPYGTAVGRALDRSAEMAPPPAAPSPGERSQWERIAVTADIEIHVRRPLARKENRIVERLLEYARKLVAEERAP